MEDQPTSPPVQDSISELKGNDLNNLPSRDYASFLNVAQGMARTSQEDLKHTVETGSLPVPVLADIVTFFSKEGQQVLDVFSGNGRMLSVAQHSDREATGLDFDPLMHKAYLESSSQDMFSEERPYLVVPDAREWFLAQTPGKVYDFIFFDPPRCRSLRGPQYKTSKDIGALKPVAFVNYLAECLEAAARLVNPGAFLAVHVDLVFDKKSLLDVAGMLAARALSVPNVRLRLKKEWYYAKAPSTLGNLGIVAPNINTATLLAFEAVIP
ncbi:hypothetical protein KW797_03520 [Candidatus Parcubacteria bacterium]|nr:hypothetical protein [Candidatus Parcubacteria bacterium]